MTLKVRNRQLMAISAAAAVCFVLAAAYFAVSEIRGTLRFPQHSMRLIPLPGMGLFALSDAATLFSAIFMVLYAGAAAVFTLLFFEKTQASEIVFFMGFLCTSLAEGARLLVPLAGSYQAGNSMVVVVTRVIAAARLMSVLVFLFSSIMSGLDQRQHIGRNFIMLIAVAVTFGTAIPINNPVISSLYIFPFGYQHLYALTSAVLIGATLLSLLLAMTRGYSRDALLKMLGLSALIGGYYAECFSDCWPMFGAGILLLCAGTLLYLRSVHRIYMWN